MSDELIDIVDENNKIIEKQLKSKAHKEGLLHRVAHVWIYNSKGEILLQLRAKNKPLFPNVWDVSAAGHITAGEEVIISALREIKEEIGLQLKEKDLDYGYIIRTSSSGENFQNEEFAYTYFYKFDGDVFKLKLQEEEVQQVKFFSFEEIENMLNNNPEFLTPYPFVFKRMLEEIRARIK